MSLGPVGDATATSGNDAVTSGAESYLEERCGVRGLLLRPALHSTAQKSGPRKTPDDPMANTRLWFGGAAAERSGAHRKGNTCYMNSIIQCLNASTPFSDEMVAEGLSVAGGMSSSLAGALFGARPAVAPGVRKRVFL